MDSATIRFRPQPFLFLLAWVLPGAFAAAAERLETARQVADLTPGQVHSNFYPGSMYAGAERLYFPAVSSSAGIEPWVSDGTAEGTRMLRDLCPGSCSAGLVPFFELGGRTFSIGWDGGRNLLFEVDAETARPVVDLPGDLPPTRVARVGGYAYFVLASRIYRTDGSAEGTEVVFRGCEESGACSNLEIFETRSILFFTNGRQLMRLLPDGGSLILAEVPVNVYGSADFGGKLAFFVTDLSADRAWISDGTPAGTFPLEPAVPPEIQRGDRKFEIWRGGLYFRGLAGAWLVSGGDPSSTLPVDYPGLSPSAEIVASNRDFLFYRTPAAPGATSFDLHAIGADGTDTLLEAGAPDFDLVGRLGEVLLFESHTVAALATDGTLAGTRHLGSAFRPRPGLAVAWQGRLYLSAKLDEPDASWGLWSTDGSAEGTRSVFELFEPRGTYPGAIRVGDSVLVSELFGARFWRLDPETLATTLLDLGGLHLFRATPRALFLVDDGFTRLVAFRGDRLETLVERDFLKFSDGSAVAPDGTFFFGLEGPGGFDLFASDGTRAGTRLLVADADRGLQPRHLPFHFPPDPIFLLGSRVLFGGSAPEGSYRIRAFDRDSGAEETILEDLVHPVEILDAGDGSALIWNRRNGATDYWSSDGTRAGTHHVATLGSDLVPGGRAGRLILLADSTFSQEWALDPRTGALSWLSPEVARDSAFSLSLGNQLFRTRVDRGRGRQIFRSDGSLEGSALVPISDPPLGAEPGPFLAVGERRFVFAADDRRGSGRELWISDGTWSGTYLLADIAAGGAASDPDSFLLVGDRLFFAATGADGRELWAIDLPPERPACPADRLCLMDDRFEVRAQTHAGGRDWSGVRVIAAAAGGAFRFFSPENWELLVSIVDGCPVYGAFGVLASGAGDLSWDLEVLDRATGRLASYRHAAGGGPSVVDLHAHPACEAAPPPAAVSPVEPLAAAASRCPDDPFSLCLGRDRRFRVGLDFELGATRGRAVPWTGGSPESGIFSIFGLASADFLVKMLDACALGGHHWLFAAPATFAGFTLTVEDRVTGETRTYSRLAGEAPAPIVDLAAGGGCS